MIQDQHQLVLGAEHRWELGHFFLMVAAAPYASGLRKIFLVLRESLPGYEIGKA